MAWSFKQAGGTESSGFPGGVHTVPDDEWLIATESVALTSGSSADQSTSVIDFIPYGKDWTIEVDPSATLATRADIDIDYSDVKDGTFVELATTAAIALKVGTISKYTVDNSVKGQRPYYKLRLDKNASLKDDADTTVEFKIYLAPPTKEIF